MQQTKSHSIYIVLSRTQTGVARVLRTFGGLEYNHVAISLDRDFTELYSFARSEQYGFLTGRLVHETTDRYLVNGENGVPILVYRLPVTEEELNWIRATIREIMADPQFVYNFFSVVTYPILGGFSTYKAFSCIEFVAYVLRELGYGIERPLFAYRPDDLRPLLEEYLCYGLSSGVHGQHGLFPAPDHDAGGQLRYDDLDAVEPRGPLGTARPG